MLTRMYALVTTFIIKGIVRIGKYTIYQDFFRNWEITTSQCLQYYHHSIFSNREQ